MCVDARTTESTRRQRRGAGHALGRLRGQKQARRFVTAEPAPREEASEEAGARPAAAALARAWRCSAAACHGQHAAVLQRSCVGGKRRRAQTPAAVCVHVWLVAFGARNPFVRPPAHKLTAPRRASCGKRQQAAHLVASSRLLLPPPQQFVASNAAAQQLLGARLPPLLVADRPEVPAAAPRGVRRRTRRPSALLRSRTHTNCHLLARRCATWRGALQPDTCLPEQRSVARRRARRAPRALTP